MRLEQVKLRTLQSLGYTALKNIHQMHIKIGNDYEEAVKTLNSLQTNAQYIQAVKKNGRQTPEELGKKLEITAECLLKTGVSLEQLDELSVIHVSGTKGKGSTCAFCESIIRHHGYKTGFYSSPHLVEVRERIRINGQPLSQLDFTKYFWEVYKPIKKKGENDMPPYFQFLTIMAFNVFLAEKVDVAIVEVGIGGEYDCTNILRKVPTVGITSLGLDHMFMLGNTIEEIAWQKAGIMKPGSITFTVDQQPKALSVLKQRASDNKSTLVTAPPLESYNWSNFKPELRTVPDVQLINASLALQLANAWILQHTNGLNEHVILKNIIPRIENGTAASEKNVHIPMAEPFTITSSMALGLKFCTWPGRNQIINHESVHYFLDGAHTRESIKLSADWFMNSSQAIVKSIPRRILMFNCTGYRDPKPLLVPLFECEFHLAIFCPNIVTATIDPSSDSSNYTVSIMDQLENCRRSQEAWCELQDASIEANSCSSNDVTHPACSPDGIYKNHLESHSSVKLKRETKCFPCISDALAYVKRKAENETEVYHVFVTGSLHLVGNVLSILDPELKQTACHLSSAISVVPSENNDTAETCNS